MKKPSNTGTFVVIVAAFVVTNFIMNQLNAGLAVRLLLGTPILIGIYYIGIWLWNRKGDK